ncbi:hypothetical protein AC077_00425 [Listeria monocytogenes]|uniref:DUF6275 family protein n=1 Tax=Listeria monocytogenes TaxID=1639 RepID=UPI0004D9296C|nr:DUF6275 family protein [Listeria monocytogenes]EAC4967771.1 hypothetical protein [Listeria monocytogenes]EAD5217917.1 hypothetical protein [Listeria monocytogenes]EAD6705617.1 hypothetical protein [Listeria monocytogenes]EAD8186802.1 hypothetical protein [Listeria monocytogenes]EAE0273290.1 hypothetical protein [Listeria monocytogenes]
MDNQEFINLCKEKVLEYVNVGYVNAGYIVGWEDSFINLYSIDNIFVVWSCKTLQNNKALLSTERPDGMYFELTYNGDKKELYFDAYKKEKNILYKLSTK